MNDEYNAFEAARLLIEEASRTEAAELDLYRAGTVAITRLPPEIAELKRLATLDLRHTHITDVAALKGMTWLKALYLDDTLIVDLGPLAGMTGLETLFLRNTQITDVAPLAGMTRMTTLDLRCPHITDVAPLAGMRGLATLKLGGSRITDLSPLAGMAGLKVLNLRGAPITDIAPISGMTGLTTLDLGNTRITDIAPLAGMTGLTSLDLRHTRITDLAPLSAMTGIAALHLRDVPATDLRPIRGLEQLAADPVFGGLIFKNSGAAGHDPRIAEIADISGPALRAQALFDYLNNWVPPNEPSTKEEAPQEGRGEVDFEALRKNASGGSPAEIGTDEELALRAKILEQIAALKDGLPKPAAHGGIGHNHPPTEIELHGDALSRIEKSLDEIRDELKKISPSIEKIAERASILENSMQWVAGKMELTINEFCKSFGSTLGRAVALMIGVLIASYLKNHVTALLSRLYEWLILVLGI